MNQTVKKQVRPLSWSRLLIAAVILVQLGFAVSGPFSDEFATAWSNPRVQAE